MPKFHRETFFDGYRAAFSPLNQKQVDGLSFLLDKLEEDDFSLPQAAYVLSTVDHETAHTFQPIKEIRERKTSPRRANQDRYWLDNFYGRGYVQITWRKNYEKFGIADDPDRALEPETAYSILSVGMKEGLFTGKKISDYINADHTNFVDARKVVNGLDRADLIAGRARKFQSILEASEMNEERRHAAKPKAVEATMTSGATSIVAEPDKPSQSEPKTETQDTVTVQKVLQSLGSKVMAGGTVVMGVVTAVAGAFLGVIKNPYAFTLLILGGAAIGAYLWNQSKERQARLQMNLNENAASRTKNTVEVSPPPAGDAA